ncbi:MAG: hypothetical protein LUC92_10140 [Clostridiales bacterium]|nr:hypothetical protein [Clostridiales bacterium]
MKLSNIIACICEGAAEQTIIEMLLENNLLIFTKEKLLDEKIIRVRKAENFEKIYLRKGFDEKITILRIIDSRREKFKLSKAYEYKVDVINVITAPEIEMLIILNEGKYDAFKKGNTKPSIFCKETLGFSDVKSSQFLKKYFRDTSYLIKAISEYHRKAKIHKEEYTLYDLLKKN